MAITMEKPHYGCVEFPVFVNTKAIPKGVPLRFFEPKADPKKSLVQEGQAAAKAAKAAASKGAGKRSGKGSGTAANEAMAGAAPAAAASSASTGQVSAAPPKRQRLQGKTAEPGPHPDID